ncbi:MAG: HAMP domain-containing histidine kinase [Bdellovibrionales bacterium]|nr:HAMP domain-containing histidine kinase [Bdellovibrionales bacterium]
MKLEKVVSRPKYGLYVFLFVVGLAVAGAMATSYNVEIIIHNLKTNVPAEMQELPWLKIILGSLGFIGIIFSLVMFFTRMIREMKISQFHADFLDRISHELRTPLSTITLVSDLLKSGHELTPAECDRLWKSHSLELDRLKTDVESLLQAARLRESRHQVNYVTIDLQQFLDDKKQSFESLLGPGATLTQQADGCSAQIRVDPNLLELILRNLLDNAKKFSLGRPVVELHARCSKKRFEISVRDQGLGFEPEKTKELFKRFSRIEPNSNQFREFAIPGTGLGLYLSASASRAMGMTLTGTSFGEGKGAEFTLSGDLAK